MWAAWGGHLEAMVALLAAGSEVDAPRAGRAKGMTSLSCAAVGGHLKACKVRRSRCCRAGYWSQRVAALQAHAGDTVSGIFIGYGWRARLPAVGTPSRGYL